MKSVKTVVAISMFFAGLSSALAHTDVGVYLGVPAPVYTAPPPVVYETGPAVMYAPAPDYRYSYPYVEGRDDEQRWHERGHHRGWEHHHHHDDD